MKNRTRQQVLRWTGVAPVPIRGPLLHCDAALEQTLGEEEVRVGEMPGSLRGKIALVTGATSGLGRAFAEHFAASGAQLMLTGRNQAAGAALAHALQARFLAGDIADPAFPARLVAETLAAFGGLDILINNAGINHRGSVL